MFEMNLTLAIVCNTIILVFGLTGAFLSQTRTKKYQKYACIFGLLSQPAWLWLSYRDSNWGIFFNSCLYACVWMFGFYNHWLRKQPPEKIETKLYTGPNFPANAEEGSLYIQASTNRVWRINSGLWMLLATKKELYESMEQTRSSS